jgi:hypothetical protein
VFHSSHLFQRTLLPILAVPVPTLFELCGLRLLPIGRGTSALNSLHPFCGQVQCEEPAFYSLPPSWRHFQFNMAADTRAGILRSPVRNTVGRAQMLSPRALREQNKSKRGVLFSISYKCQFFQLLLNHILANSGGGGFFSWHRIVTGYSQLTTHHSPLTIDCSLPPPITSTDRCGATPNA